MNTAECVEYLANMYSGGDDSDSIVRGLSECAAHLAYYASSDMKLPSVTERQLLMLRGHIVYIPAAKCCALVDIDDSLQPLLRFHDGSTSLASDWYQCNYEIHWLNNGVELPTADIDSILDKLTAAGVENAKLRNELFAANTHTYRCDIVLGQQLFQIFQGYVEPVLVEAVCFTNSGYTLTTTICHGCRLGKDVFLTSEEAYAKLRGE